MDYITKYEALRIYKKLGYNLIKIMDYELAKKLKDVGWKQKLDKSWQCVHWVSSTTLFGCVDYKIGDRLSMCSKCGRGVNKGENYVYFPTLSELINECIKLSKDGDFHLEHLHNEWGASTCWKPKEEGKWYTGKTLEIAVARLYLHLK